MKLNLILISISATLSSTLSTRWTFSLVPLNFNFQYFISIIFVLLVSIAWTCNCNYDNYVFIWILTTNCHSIYISITRAWVACRYCTLATLYCNRKEDTCIKPFWYIFWWRREKREKNGSFFLPKTLSFPMDLAVFLSTYPLKLVEVCFFLYCSLQVHSSQFFTILFSATKFSHLINFLQHGNARFCFFFSSLLCLLITWLLSIKLNCLILFWCSILALMRCSTAL